jgi:hypothetical protein
MLILAIAAMVGSLMVLTLRSIPSSTDYAEKKDPKRNPKKGKTGESPEVKNQQCSQVQGNGESVHYGKCGNVCKGKEVKVDHGGHFGTVGGNYCK